MKNNIYIDFSYLLLIAATFGAVVVLGAFVAPVIFYTYKLFNGFHLDSYSAGVIMAEIFRRFSYWLYILAFFVLFYEMLMYKKGQRDALVFGSSVTVVFSALMFSAVYSPKIVGMQILGPEATQSDTFKNIHLASELDFKILAIALLILFVRRLMLLRIK
ncbi:MAG: hypothetical protein QG559_477 [Campylobacterota bacterium]|nr:hypothetical protein [Campylobacterota bacterium]